MSIPLLVVGLCVAPLGAQDPTANPAKAPPAGQDLRRTVDAYLGPLVEARLFSGAILLARDGEVVLRKAYGRADFEARVPNTTDTRFKLMSVTKAVTAVAVMTLSQSGALELGDKVAKHLTGWPETWQDVTIRQLMSHTSGIPNLERELFTVAKGPGLWPRLAPRIAERSLATRGEARFRYSNFNFVLLGCVVEAASGRPYADYLKSAVLDPLGMDHTGCDDGSRFGGLAVGYFRGRDGTLAASEQDMSVIQAAGGLYSTVRDLYRLDRALGDDDLLRAPAREAMLAPVSPTYACGWQVDRVLDRACVHHSGGSNGYVADFLRFPEQDACVVVLSNFAFAPVGRISHDLTAILFGEPCITPTNPEPDALDACAGVYSSPSAPGRALVIRRSGLALLAFDVRDGSERVGGRLLVPISDVEYARPWSGARLRFDRPDGERATSVRSSGPGGELLLERDAAASEPWRKAAGSYRVEPPLGESTRIVEDSGRLLVRHEHGFPAELELVPLSATLAIALASEEFGTLLHLDRDGDGAVRGFTWERADGATFRGTRSAR